MLELSAFDIIYLFCTFLGIVAASILYFWHGSNTCAVRWLSLSYLAFTLCYISAFLVRTKLMLDIPQFYRTGFLFSLLYMPLSYLYVRWALTKKKQSWWDLLHALPVVLFLIDGSGYYFTSSANKLAILQQEYISTDSPISIAPGLFLSMSFKQAMIIYIPGIYWLGQVFMLLKLSKVRAPFFRKENEVWIKWILFYLSFQLMIQLPIFILFFSGHGAYLLALAQIFGLLMSIFITLTLFVHPELTITAKPAFLFPEKSDPGIARVRTANSSSFRDELKEDFSHVENGGNSRTGRPLKNLTRKQITQMKVEIEAFLKRDQAFLQHGYSLQELATSLSYPLYLLSALINAEYGTHFNDFINKYRIEYAVEIIKDGKSSHLNINGLADQCGFSNRNSFTTAFKRVTGLTPSEYFKEHDLT